MALLQLDQILEVEIDRLSVGGRGVARHDGAVIFVERTAPRERVQVKVSFVKKNYAEAELLEVLVPSNARIEAPCPFYKDCGGCNWQHISYPEQLKQKQMLVHESLQKLSGFSDFKVEECVPSTSQFRYRNRIQVHTHNGKLGFFKKNTHEIAPIDDCLITDEKITAKFEQIRKSSEAKKTPRAQRIELKLDGMLEAESADLGFSQVNSLQNINLQKLVCELAKSLTKEQKSLQVFDLYCGNGNLSFVLAEALPQSKIVGVELSPKNVAQAKDHLKKIKHQGQIEFHQAKVETFLSSTTYDLTTNLVILDPPRTGCDPLVMQALASKKPRSIIYVSCHPATLARDLKFLSVDYKILVIKPLDMFPQTDHVECVVALQRNT